MNLVRKADQIVVKDLDLAKALEIPGPIDARVTLAPVTEHTPCSPLLVIQDETRTRYLCPRTSRPFMEFDDAAIEEIVLDALGAIRDRLASERVRREDAAGPEIDVVAIVNIGAALYGAGRWQAPLARDLGWSQALLTRIVSGERPLTDARKEEWRKHLAEVIRPRAADLLSTIDKAISRHANDRTAG